MQVNIDPSCGFCSGVKRAIALAEKSLEENPVLYCLGELIHNQAERERLQEKGLVCIDQHEFSSLPAGSRVLIRTHGEPPSSFDLAAKKGLILLDATCPVVKRLQHRVRKTMEETGGPEQLIIVGKKKHAEVKGLLAHSGGSALVVENEADLEAVHPGVHAVVYAQTTAHPKNFARLAAGIKKRVESGPSPAGITIFSTICRQMSDREPRLVSFALEHDLLVFVSDPMSSNGRMLYETARAANANTRFVTGPGEIDPSWLEGVKKAGVSGATSTPPWLLEKVADKIRELKKSKI